MHKMKLFFSLEVLLRQFPRIQKSGPFKTVFLGIPVPLKRNLLEFKLTPDLERFVKMSQMVVTEKSSYPKLTSKQSQSYPFQNP